jgi:hypothetical protein
MKDLFFPVTGATSDDAALDTAAAVASAYGARLIATVPAPAYAPLATPWGVTPDSVALGEMLAVIEAESRMRAQSLRERLKNLEPASEIRIDPDHFFEPSRSLARQARYADLSLIACPQGRDGANRPCVFPRAAVRIRPAGAGGPIASHSGEAVLEDADRMEADARNHARRARCHLHSSRLARRKCSRSIRKSACSSTAPNPVPTSPRTLARHGIRTQVTTRPSASQSIRAGRHGAREGHGADLVVAGGYGHGRLREWVLGGAPRGKLFEGLRRPGAVFTLRRGRTMCGIPTTSSSPPSPGGTSCCSRASCTRSSGSSVDRRRTQRALRAWDQIAVITGQEWARGPGCVAPGLVLALTTLREEARGDDAHATSESSWMTWLPSSGSTRRWNPRSCARSLIAHVVGQVDRIHRAECRARGPLR